MDLGTIFSSSSFQSYQPSFDEIIDGLWNAFDRPLEAKSERFKTLKMEVLITLDQAQRGGRLRLQLPMQHSCDTCRGLGEGGPFYCWRCDGTGFSRSELFLEVEYPPGITDRFELAIPLDRYGILDICPIIVFRISHEGDFADLF